MRRANELAKLTSHTTLPTVIIRDQSGRATIMVRQMTIPFFFGILHHHLRLTFEHPNEMLNRDHHSRDDRRKVDFLFPIQIRAWDDVSHRALSNKGEDRGGDKDVHKGDFK